MSKTHRARRAEEYGELRSQERRPLVTPVAPPPSRPKAEPRWMPWVRFADKFGAIITIAIFAGVAMVFAHLVGFF